MHTNYSDGKFTPSELLLKAAAAGLKTIAITDHDNAGGARLAAPLAAEMGIELVPGIEVTTAWPSLKLPPGETDVDLLGYFVDFKSPAFLELEQDRTADIRQRVAECCELIQAAGYPLSLVDVQAVNANFPSLTAAILALQGKGYAADWNAARRIIMDAWQKVRPPSADIGSVIERIHAAGGAAVLAHPAVIACPVELAGAGQDGLIGEPQVAELAGLGLDGLEVYHHRNDAAARSRLLALAGRFNLAVSGGSDEHGWWTSRLATQPVTQEMLDALRTRAR